MFTGIVTDQGKILSARPVSNGISFKIATNYDADTINIGASIACNGCCLTVTNKGRDSSGDWFCVEAWEEAIKLTNAAEWRPEHVVNLERSLKLGDEYGGHMVTGHIDGMATIHRIEQAGDAMRFFLEAPQHLAKFIVPKGSVALDGTSLTVNNVNNCCFDVLIIRHTLKVTTWGAFTVGRQVNLEVDQIARYVVRLVERQQAFSSV